MQSFDLCCIDFLIMLLYFCIELLSCVLVISLYIKCNILFFVTKVAFWSLHKLSQVKHYRKKKRVSHLLQEGFHILNHFQDVGQLSSVHVWQANGGQGQSGMRWPILPSLFVGSLFFLLVYFISIQILIEDYLLNL